MEEQEKSVAAVEQTQQTQQTQQVQQPKPKKGKLKNFIDEKNLTKKKIIKLMTIVMAIALIVFSTVSNAVIDPEHLNFFKWITNALVFIAIMIFGLLMGESLGEEEQKDKVGGLYQTSLADYDAVMQLIQGIKIYFADFFLWFKVREIKQEKIDYLMDNEIDGKWAAICVKYLEKSDFVLDKFIFNEEKPKEKIYLKELPDGKKVKIHKATLEEANKIIKMFDVKIETYGYAYYLTCQDNEIRGGKLRKAVPLNKHLHLNKTFNRVLKIVSTLFISLIWGMLTVQEFSSPEERKQAWFLLFSRIMCLFSSIISGWTSAVISVKIQAQIINNKKDVLQDFKDSVDKKLFIPESYDEMVEREYREQMEALEQQEEQSYNESTTSD